MTFGEQRIRTDFNPSANSLVDIVKQKSAELINILLTEVKNRELSNQEFNNSTSFPATEEELEQIKKNDINIQEYRRLAALAYTNYELACMWAVKALTTSN